MSNLPPLKYYFQSSLLEIYEAQTFSNSNIEGLINLIVKNSALFTELNEEIHTLFLKINK